MEVKNIMNDIKTQLSSEQIKNKIVSDLGLEFKGGKCKCFIHSESNPSMAFDSKRNRFKCFSCGATYDLFDHYQRYYNKSFLEALKSIVSDFNLLVDLFIKGEDKKPLKMPTIHKNDISKVIKYIESRKISKATMDYVGIKEEKGNVVFEYRNEFGNHVSNKYRPAKKLNSGDLKMWFEKDTNSNTLFNMDKINIDKPLIICEGEFDCMSLIECGLTNSVSVPTGCHSVEWLEVNWDFISQFEEVVICFDNDEAGKKASRDIASRLENDTIKIVNISQCNDVNELLFRKGKEAVINTIRSASELDIDGIITLDQIGNFDIYEAEKVKTGFKKIDDEIIGMVMGSLNVFTGENGAGKSTMLNQILIGEGMAQGHKCFLFSGELTKENVKYWLMQTIAGEEHYIEATSKENTKYKRVSTEGIGLIEKYANDKVFLYNDDYDIDVLVKVMEKLVKKKGVKVFIIDNLMVLECFKYADELQQQKYIVKTLKNFAKRFNAIVHLVAHPKKQQRGQKGLIKDDIAGTGNITNLADYVTSIVRVSEEEKEEKEAKGEPIYDAEYHILKNRHTGKLPKIALRFDNVRKRFYSNGEELSRNYGYYTKEYTQQEDFTMIEGEW